eukprot:TRINITY_DN10680_c0_g1_i2.p1 TRINITY_DN10680_c0_g1~~TRINITY_DN10680_c0_g1_i2.p1  ORF type:complete len:346 (-),score=97.66 TRINITY_DN10680_c0_g1_i2:23-1060(-)
MEEKPQSEAASKGHNTNTFTGNPLDRCHDIRKDVQKMKDLRKDATSLFVPYHKLKPLLNDQNRIVWMSRQDLDKILQESLGGDQQPSKVNKVLLGRRNNVAYFAVEITAYENLEKFKPLGQFSELRLSAAALPEEEAGILAQGRSLLDWHIRHPFCPKCGNPTKSTEGGVKRTCINDKCKTPQYPRTDVCVIMLVTAFRKKQDSDEQEEVCLLASRAQGYKGIYTCLAGFLEIGESIEEAVKREVEEESGINLDIKKMMYHSSQPWPYPSQLMVGVIAQTNYVEKPTFDQTELGDGGWYTRPVMREVVKRSESLPLDPNTTYEFRIPPAFAIAHQIIKTWANQKE